MLTKKTHLLHVAVAVLLVMTVWLMPFKPLGEVVLVGAEVESAPVPGSGTDEIVQIPDQNLKDRLAIYDSNRDGNLSVAEMEAIRFLYIYASYVIDEIQPETITTLDGLQYATNLVHIEVSNVVVEDYSALSELANVERLYLKDTPVNDLTFLNNMSSLKNLMVNGTGIADISSLSSLTNLETLSLMGNGLTAIDSITGLENITELYVGNNQIQQLPDFSGMTNLTSLSIENNLISDLTNLSTVQSLSYVDLSDNEIANIDILDGIDTLSKIVLSGNSISDITVFESMPQIVELELANNSITNIDALKSLANMDLLNLESNAITDIPDLSSMTEVRFIDLSNNNISNVDQIASIPALQALDLSNNNLTSISSLANIGNSSLQSLYLNSNNIEDISVLDDIVNASEEKRLLIDLSMNEIADVSVINDFTKIVPALNLSNCNISDISYLNDPKVINLDLSNNEIVDVAFLSDISYITDLNLSGNKIVSTSNVDNIVWNSLIALNLSNNLLTDVDFFANFTNPHTVGFIDFSNNRLSNISPLAEAASKLTIYSMNFSNNKLTDISPINAFYADPAIRFYGLNISDNYLDVSEGSTNLNIIKGWQEREIEAIYSDQKTIADPTPAPTPVPDKEPDPTPAPTPVPDKEPDPTPTPVPPQKPAATPTPAPSVPEQPKSESGATIITNPYNKTEKEYTKPVTQVAVTEEELLVDHHDSIPAVVAKMDKTVYSEPVKLAVKPVDISTEEGKAKLAAVEKEVDRILTLVKAQSSTAVTEEAKIEKVVLLDLSLMTVNGSQSVQPTSGKVTITIPLPDGFDPAKTVIAHAKSNGTVELLKTTIADGWITFETNSFSPFSIMQLSVPAAEVLAAVEAESDIKIDADQMQKTGENGNNSWMFLPLSLIISGALVIRRKLVLAENETAE